MSGHSNKTTGEEEREETEIQTRPNLKYRYHVFFADSERWSREPPFSWSLKGDLKRPQISLAIEDQKWPTKFDEDSPSRQLPLDIVFVLTHSLSQMYYLLEEPYLRSRLAHADYFLSLCESETPSSWRKTRPTTDPVFPCSLRAASLERPDVLFLVEDGDGANTSGSAICNLLKDWYVPNKRALIQIRWTLHTLAGVSEHRLFCTNPIRIVPSSEAKRRQYARPNTTTRGTRAAQNEEPYWAYSSEPGARQQPLPALLNQGKGLVFTSSEASEGLEATQIAKKKRSSS